MERLASRELVGHDSSTSFLLRTVEDKQLDLLLPNIAVGLGASDLKIPNWIVPIRNAAAAAAAATTAVDSFNGTVVVAATAAATAA